MMRRHSTARASIAVIATVFLLAGCSGNDGEPTGIAPEATEQVTEPAPAAPGDDSGESTDDEAAASGPLDAVQAARRAVELVSGGAVVELEQGREGGVEVWDIDVLQSDGSGTTLYLDRQTGETIRQRPVQLSPPQTNAPAIPAHEAIGAALGAVPGEIVELDLDTDRGRVVWEALIAADAGGHWEVYVDAATGEVLKQERDD